MAEPPPIPQYVLDSKTGPRPQPPSTSPLRFQPASTTDPSPAIPWYRRHGWMTFLVWAPTLFGMSLGFSGLGGIMLVVGPLLLLLYAPVLLAVLVTGPIYGGSHVSGKWALSTQIAVILYLLASFGAAGWVILSPLLDRGAK